MGAGGTPSDFPDEVRKEWAESVKESYIRLGLKPEVNPDDVQYNKEWWDQYCKDNKINPSSGK